MLQSLFNEIGMCEAVIPIRGQHMYVKLATGLILCMQTEVIETRNKDIIKDLGAVRLLVAGIPSKCLFNLGLGHVCDFSRPRDH